MKSINKITLIGAVGQDPETRFTAAGLAVTNFSLATSEKRKDKEEVTQWHNCVAFGKLAEIVQQYVAKGSKIYVDGTLQYQVVDKEGVTTKYAKIIVNDLSMLSSSKEGQAKGAQKASSRAPASNPSQMEDFDDDIPF